MHNNFRSQLLKSVTLHIFISFFFLNKTESRNRVDIIEGAQLEGIFYNQASKVHNREVEDFFFDKF